MKIAIISDVHGNLLALKAVLADIDRQSVDQTVNLGDLLSGPLQPAETADLLIGLGLVTIRGNHERQVLALLAGPASEIDTASTDGYTARELLPAHIDWLKSLPSTLALNDEVLLCHGTPDSDLLYWLDTVVPGYLPEAPFEGNPGVRAATAQEVAERLVGVGPLSSSSTSNSASTLSNSITLNKTRSSLSMMPTLPTLPTMALILCGHTHLPRVVQSGRTLIVNPGSVGLQAYDDTHPLPHIMETGAPHARYAVVERTGDGWRVDLRMVPYDHQTQADVARRRGRHDWAHALATGRAI